MQLDPYAVGHAINNTGKATMYIDFLPSEPGLHSSTQRLQNVR